MSLVLLSTQVVAGLQGQSIFRDDFNGPLRPGWVVQSPAGGWSFDSGRLRLPPKGNAFSLTSAQPRNTFLYPNQNGSANFQITIRRAAFSTNATPVQALQLLAFDDNNNYVSGFYYCCGEGGSPGYGIQGETNGAYQGGSGGGGNFLAAYTHMRLTKSGTNYVLSFSTDGLSFSNFTSLPGGPAAPRFVGFLHDGGSTAALLDYFAFDGLGAATNATVKVVTNLPNATFKVIGPTRAYSGGGTSFVATVPAGEYTIVYDPLAGYTTPPAEFRTLQAGIAHSFSGVYKADPVVYSAFLAEPASCSPLVPMFTPPKWGPFGSHWALESKAGDKFEISCSLIGEYFLIYTDRNGVKFRVGMCPFNKGTNRITIYYNGTESGQPKEFIQTQWISKDYGSNDNPNPWTGELHEDLLDWAVSTFDVKNRHLTKESYKFEYATSPPISQTPSKSPEAGAPMMTPLTQTRLDPPIGPETEAFYDAASAIRATLPAAESIATGGSVADLNGDGAANETDFGIFQASFGACTGSSRYSLNSDLNLDGCVNFRDYQLWLRVYQEGRGQ